MRTTDRYAALNRRARHDYLIEDKLEAGLVLHGTEVKSLRQGGASIAEAYADVQSGELFLVNANIPEYKASAHFNHQPRRPRKLLLHRKQMDRLLGAVRREGVTIVPLALYFNELGRARPVRRWDAAHRIGDAGAAKSEAVLRMRRVISRGKAEFL